MKKIHYELDKEVALMTMDDGKVNAMDFLFFDEMGKTMDRLEEDGAKAVIIAGRPGCFSGGLDLKLMPSLSSTDLVAFLDLFARTMLRVFSLPIPTIAVCTGHTIAGGGILAFACDLRFVVDGPYRIQMNEMVTRMPFPSWMILIGRASIPPQYLIEVFLHAKTYDPEEAVKKEIFQGLIEKQEDGISFAKARAGHLKVLDRQAYGLSKKRMRASEIECSLELLKGELQSITKIGL